MRIVGLLTLGLLLCVGLLLCFAGLQPTHMLLLLCVIGGMLSVTRVNRLLQFAPKIVAPEAVVLGTGVILLPLIGSQALFGLLLVFIWTKRHLLKGEWFIPWLPLLLIAAVSAVSDLWLSGVAEIFKFFLLDQDVPSLTSRLQRLLVWVGSDSSVGLRGIEWLIRGVLLVAIASIVASDRGVRDSLGVGLVVGAALALPVGAWQVFSLSRGLPASGLLTGYSDFWSAQPRIPLTFSDPNAFGLAGLLLLPLILSSIGSWSDRSKWIIRGICISWLPLLFFSGSRSLALGMGCLLIALLVRRRRHLVAGMISLIVIIAALNLSASLQRMIQLPEIPSTVQRALSSLVLSNLGDTIMTRGLFFEISSTIFSYNPWLGIGLERYRDFVVPLSYATPGVIPLWTDNANSFYIGLAVELGLVGLFFLLAGMLSYRWRDDAPRIVLVTAKVFLGLLILGPHLDFNEVTALFGICLGVVAFPRQDRQMGWSLCAAIALIPLVFLNSSLGQYGFSRWEWDGKRYFRWSGPTARGWLHCQSDSGQAQLLLRAARADTTDSPVSVVLHTPRAEGVRLALKGDAITPATISCPNSIDSVAVPYRITIPELYAQPDRDTKRDPRVFGVQVVSRDPRMTLPF